MTTLLNFLVESGLAQRLGWVLLHSLWQITLLAGVYALVRRVVPKRFIAFRYYFGFGVMVMMVIVPVVSVQLFQASVPWFRKKVSNSNSEVRSRKPEAR
jgi:hypothetical protein